MVRISAFRYLVPGKRATLPPAQEDKAKAMGLGDCGLDASETELMKFWLSHGVVVSTNSIYSKNEYYKKVGAISGGLAERTDFLTEVKEWLTGNLNLAAKNTSETEEQPLFDVYILFYSGTGVDGEGDIMLPQGAAANKLDAAFAQQGRGKKEKVNVEHRTTVSLADIERVWDEFKRDNFPIMGHTAYRNRYYSRATDQDGPVMTKEHFRDNDLAEPELGKVGHLFRDNDLAEPECWGN